MIVFIRNELYFYIGRAPTGTIPEAVVGTTSEDFPITISRDRVHCHAHSNVIELLDDMIQT